MSIGHAHKLCLDPLNFPQLDARAMMGVAAEAGYACVGLTLLNAMTGRLDSLIDRPDQMREAKAWLTDQALQVHNLECFNLVPDLKVDALQPVLDAGAQLGAREATAIIWGNPDHADALMRYRRLCDIAQDFGIRINIEFMAISSDMATLDQAVRFVREADRSNSGILVDLLHLMRSGGSIDALTALDPALIGYAQLCDAPSERIEERLMDEAGAERLDPGMGGLPVRDFLTMLPSDMVVGLEVPQHSRQHAVTPLDRAREMKEAANRLVALQPGTGRA